MQLKCAEVKPVDPLAFRAAIQQRLAQDGIHFILAQFVDLHGAAKVKMAPAQSLGALVDEGAGFAGGALWGMGQGPHSHDMMGRIDLDTYTPLGWQPETCRFACDLYVDGEMYPYCPRVNLKRVLGLARERGYVLNVGIEPEHFLVVPDGNGGIAPWDPLRVDRLAKPCYDFKGIAPALGYLQDLIRFGNALGWGVYQTDHEDANGQFEVNFAYSDALTTADRYTFFKMMTSQVAQRYGAVATHMPKPFVDRTGSGAHMHYHLAGASSGENLFVDAGDRRGLGISRLGYHFLGGILRHAAALCAVASPTVNCYKRLVSGEAAFGSRSGFTWTPAFISYGDNNRTQMLRVCGPGHVEDRSVSAGCNPYLVFAAYVAAGLDGIEKEMEPGEPNPIDLYHLDREEAGRRSLARLPGTLKEALDALESDQIVQDALGPIAGEFIPLKRREWEDYHREISPWEIERYLTSF